MAASFRRVQHALTAPDNIFLFTVLQAGLRAYQPSREEELRVPLLPGDGAGGAGREAELQAEEEEEEGRGRGQSGLWLCAAKMASGALGVGKRGFGAVAGWYMDLLDGRWSVGHSGRGTGEKLGGKSSSLQRQPSPCIAC